MRTLGRVAATPTPIGDPLPTVFPKLADAGIVPRRGTAMMVAALPGSMKTYLVTKWVIEMGLPTLFFSADMDSQSMVERAATIVTGKPQSEVRQELRNDGVWRYDFENDEPEYYSDALNEKVGHIRWVFESDPTYYDLEIETEAFAEVHGDFPQVIVVDTLMKVVGESESEWSAIRQVTKVLDRLARVTGAAIIVLHHMNEENKKQEGHTTYPAPRAQLAGKVSQTARLILSMAMDKRTGELRIAKVKDSWGTDYPEADQYESIWIDPEKGKFYNSRGEMNAGIEIRSRK